MKYSNTVKGKFISRHNRFIASVEIDGCVETVHVKNTGRCKELLIPRCDVILEKSLNPGRKTAYDLVAVYKGDVLVNMDSQAPNAAADEWLREGAGGAFERGLYNGTTFCADVAVKREVFFGDSRLDFCVEHDGKKTFIEVKGVTLEQSGVALFPDAPTERGIKHIHELENCIKDGHDAWILFVIQMKGATEFCPNDATHKEFGEALRKAYDAGVKIIAMDCYVSEDSMSIDSPVPVVL